MTGALRVLVADDHPMFLRGVRDLLHEADGIEVVGEATDGREAVARALELHPDVIVIDLHMPELGGIEAIRRIASGSGAAILALTMAHDDDSVFAAIRAGARGYLLKGADGEELIRAIRAVAEGEAVFGPGVAERVLSFLTAGPAAAAPARFPGLTEREQQVVELIARGLRNQAIAAQLGLSPKTVMNYISNVFTKLQVADRSEMIVRAREAGYGTEHGGS